MADNNDDQKLKEAEERIEQMINDAQERSYSIIHDARDIASQIIEGAEKIAQEMRLQYQQEFESATQRQAKAYEEMLSHIRAEALSLFQNEVATFKKNLGDKAQTYSEDVASKLEAEWQKINQSVEEYKQQRLADIDTQIKLRVDEIAKEVLGKAISKEDQLGTVRQAIADAKKRHGW